MKQFTTLAISTSDIRSANLQPDLRGPHGLFHCKEAPALLNTELDAMRGAHIKELMQVLIWFPKGEHTPQIIIEFNWMFGNLPHRSSSIFTKESQMPCSEYWSSRLQTPAPFLKLKVRKFKQLWLVKRLDSRFGGADPVFSLFCYSASLYSARTKDENNFLFPLPCHLILILQRFNSGHS